MAIKRSVDHGEIRQWVEQQGGRPTSIHMSDGQLGVIRFTYDKEVHPWKPITWDEFFVAFEQRKLAFVYEDDLAKGDEELMTKLVNRGAIQQPGEKASFDRIAS